MPITANIQKRARKSVAPIRPQINPPPSTNSSTDGTVCHLCGYLGRTRLLSIEKHGYSFLRHLPPASGALFVNENTQHVRACHLCSLLLDKQRELNHTSNNFFFKGFFRSAGSCHNNDDLPVKRSSNSTNEQEQPNETEISKEITPLSDNPLLITTKTNVSMQQSGRTAPPPLRKAASTVISTDLFTDLSSTDDIRALDSCLSSIHSRFLSDYTSIVSSSNQAFYKSCRLCLSVKPHGTFFTIFKNQFNFLSAPQIDVCTLCYYNLMDQYKNEVTTYRRPRPQCYLCRCRIHFVDWEVKLLETEHFPFLLKLANENRILREQLYDSQRLALVCDSCFYALLFQYIDQQRQNIAIERRSYTWQSTYSYEIEHSFNDYQWAYTSDNKTS
ncbi:unnamed protein product [Adineta ricciae]|uniref:Uncharacterized protein n=1 Tax=Adineta ricciae TaxID=249248 RepID=A0A813MB81_ADIRI|nr:unnamed protein product [Adineta ricciae]CAF0858298.1 unnamed protein product [Adineta ricciae]